MIVVLVGPTAVGKSDVSLELAEEFDAEIINADSVQVYKDMNIASNKLPDLKGIKHHLFDEVDLENNFTAYDFQQRGRKILDENPRKNFIICGGTALYIKALLNNYQFHSSDKYDSYTPEMLQKEALKRNKEIDINNIRRLKSFLINDDLERPNGEDEKLYDYLVVGIKEERDILYERINERVLKMIDEGLIEEAKALYKYKDTKALKTAIGYKELFLFLEGKITKEEAIELIQKRTRNYAKRQMTFFNNKMDVKWFKKSEINEMIEYIGSWGKENEFN